MEGEWINHKKSVRYMKQTILIFYTNLHERRDTLETEHMHVQLKNMLKENKEKCKSTEDMKNDRSPEHDRYTN